MARNSGGFRFQESRHRRFRGRGRRRGPGSMPNRPICLTCRPTLGCLGAMGFFSDRIAHPLCLATCTLLLGCWSSEESGKPAVVAPEEVLITTKVALDRERVEYEKAKEACRECAEEHGKKKLAGAHHSADMQPRPVDGAQPSINVTGGWL